MGCVHAGAMASPRPRGPSQLPVRRAARRAEPHTPGPDGGDPSGAGSPPAARLTVHVPPGEVLRTLLVTGGVALGVYLLWRVEEVLLLLLLAILLATAIEPLVNRLRRGPFTRGSGVLVVYTAIVLAIGLPAYIALPGVLAQGATFLEQLPDRLQAFRSYAAAMQPPMLRDAVVAALDRASAAARSPAAPAEQQIVEAGASAVHTAFDVVTVFVLAFYWLVERASLKRVVLRLLSHARAREVNTIWLEVEQKLGGWVRGELLLMLAIGVMSGVGYALLGLPNPLLLAVAAALFEIIPMVGPILSAAPAVLVALAIDPPRALAVAAFALVIQQVENNVLVPRVMGHTVGVSPLAVLVGILVGAVLYGLPGAFLAVPLAGAAQVILAHALQAEDDSQAEVHQQVRGTADRRPWWAFWRV